jgi:hypothetical protein
MKNLFRILFSVLIVASVTLFSTGCKKDKNLPVISTTAVSDIYLANATGGGTITDDGGSAITGRGVCWSTSQNPTINDYIAVDHTGNDNFEVAIPSLQWATTYYVRAYATNSDGTAYGESVSFTTRTPNTLVYIDYSIKDDKVEEALAAQRCNVTSVASASAFATGLTSGNYDLAVLFTQNFSTNSYASSITKDIISTYINGGGLMIYDTFSNGTDAEYAALFNASFTNNTANTKVTLTDPLMIAKAGVTTFTTTGSTWTISCVGLSALTGGTVLANFGNGDAAIILGNEGHTMMLGYLSDTPATNIQKIFESVLIKLNASI